MALDKNSFGLSEAQINLITEVFSKFQAINTVVIFGSRSMGTSKRGSDIDLAIKDSSLDLKQLLKIKAELNERIPLPHKVDLVNFDAIDNEELKAHIIEHGKLFYERQSEQPGG